VSSSPLKWAIWAICWVLMGSVCRADAQPAAQAIQDRSLDPLAIVQHLRARTIDLNLTEEQETRVAQIFDDAQRQAQLLQDELSGAGPTERMERVQPFLRELRQRLAQTLTPEQLRVLREQVATQPAGALAIRARFRAALTQLDLSDEQKKQVDDLLGSTDGRLFSRPFAPDFREKLLAILTPDQRLKLRELVTGDDSPPPMVRRRPAANAVTVRPTTSPVGAAVGSAAPPFKLQTPTGYSVQLSSFAGRVLILEFGSMSCPSFRDRIQAMRDLYEKYETRAAFLLVYTREAHPTGGWEVERNTEDSIDLTQPKDLAERRALAEKVKEALHIIIPMVVDTMDDAASNAYGGFPNATVIIGRDGSIVARQQWTDPSGLPRLIDAAVGK
jgi:Iodothyronine deiodinase